MTLQTVLDSIVFWDSSDHPAEWQMSTADQNEVSSNTDTSFRQDFEHYIEVLYNGSQTMRDLLETASANAIYVAKLLSEPGKSFTLSDPAFIAINFDEIDTRASFNDNGQYVPDMPELVIAHEFAHRYWVQLGYPSRLDPQRDAVNENSATFDHKGNMVRFQNTVATELGYDDAIRSSYLSSGDISDFPLWTDFTKGQQIDISRRAYIGAPLDTSTRTDASRDLLLGSGGADLIKSGDGADYLWGFEGNDTLEGGSGYDLLVGDTGDDILRGGEGNDELFGGEDNDILDAGSGDDFLTGGSGDDTMLGGPGNDEIWGGENGEETSIGIDIVDYSDAAKRIKIVLSEDSLIVHDGDGGMDTLHAINEIKGTQKRDLFTLEGSISTEMETLTIDANGGQGSSPKDTINLSSATSDILLHIDENGDGSILDLDTTGVIYLKGFHTSLLGSQQNDNITDESSGPKHIFGDHGDDVISAIGGPAYVDGGAGNDTITGGIYNDVLIGGLGSDTINGGGGSDLLIGNVSTSSIFGEPTDPDTLNGGDGADMLINGAIMIGGAGNDIIDARGYNASIGSGAIVKFQAGDGHDWIYNDLGADPFSLSRWSSGIGLIDLSTVNAADVTVYWDGVPASEANDPNSHQGYGTLSIVLATGDSISMENVFGSYYVEAGGDKVSFWLDVDVQFATGFLGSPLEQRPEYPIYISSYTYADVALSDYSSGLAGGDVLGTGGDDQLEGSSGDDNISAGDGNDDISLSGGLDLIDGGNGDDTVTFFGSIFDFQLENFGVGVRMTSLSGLEGVATITSVENFYSITDDRTWTMAELFGKISSSGNDVMVGTEYDDELYADDGDDIIFGHGGDDRLEGENGDDTLIGGTGDDRLYGGIGNDKAVFQGNSSDYLISSFYGDQSVIDLVGIDGWDVLNGVESLYFEGDQVTILTSDINEIQGTEFDDTIVGTNGRDSIYGYGGHDAINAGDGDDEITSSPGQNLIDGGNGSDIVSYWGYRADYEITLNSNGSVYVVGLNDVTTNDVLTNVERLFFEGDMKVVSVADLVPSEPSGPLPIYGTSSDDTLVGTAGDDTIYGLDGNDSIDGGAGADTMYGAAGNDFYTVDNSGDVIIEAAWEGWDGVSSSVSYTLADNVEGLYLGAGGAINGTGNDLDNEIYGSDFDNTLTGLGGADYLVGGYGNDRLIGGEGDDLLVGGDGSADVAVYAGLQASYTIATFNGSVTITDNAPTVDGDEGTDTLSGVEIVEFQGGIQTGISSPIILDLNGDGVTLVDNKKTKVGFDWDGDGVKNQTGWIGKDDGFLFIDRDGNGTVSNAGELSFVTDKEGAKSDLDGLRAFDSNDDGILSAADEQFSQFKVWQDKNGNGRVDKREILSLQKAGVASIDLAGEAVNQSWEWGENITVNTGSFTRSNGSIGSFSDVALSYDTGSSQNASANKAASQLSEAIASFWSRSGTAEFGKFDALAERRDNFFAAVQRDWR